MKAKVQSITAGISETLKGIDSVEVITLHESGEEDIYDPYFFISFDVYYRGDLPSREARQRLFPEAGAFESSAYVEKDRFFIEDIPVRVEYKRSGRIDSILDNKEDNLWAFRSGGTYLFYRIRNGSVLFQKGDWFDSVLDRIASFPDTFWGALRESFLASMEHHLVDLSSAVLRKDDLFYLISLSGFIRSVCSLVFAVNRRFEPSGRSVMDQIVRLPALPENFRGRFESLLREDPELPQSRKKEIAEILAKSLVTLR